MTQSRFGIQVLTATACYLAAAVGMAQDYPSKSIRMLAGAPGGSSDFAARLTAQGLTAALGQSVIVENRSFGVMAIELAAKAPPDGYTLLFYGSALWTGPLLQPFSYDPVKDFVPVTLVMTLPNLLVVHPNVPATSVKELIALAKSKPGSLNYASGELGSTAHINAELFKAMTGTHIVRVPYKGGGPAMSAMLSGEVQLTFGSITGGAPHVKSGKLRGLGVTSAQRSPAAPDVPTIAEAGVPGYESVQRTGSFAPARTPVALINRLHQETARMLARGDMREKFVNAGTEPVAIGSQEFARQIKAEMTRLRPVFKNLNIQ